MSIKGNLPMKHKKNMRMRLKVVTVLGSLPLLLGLIGCSTIKLYPIAQQDIVIMKKDEAYTPDRDGFFLSDLYMQEVMRAKVERVKIK